MASISGMTRINGNIESCTVRLYDRDSGGLISEVLSDDVTGEYYFLDLNPSTNYDVVCIGSVEVCPRISGPLSPIVNTDYYDAVISSGPTAYWRMDDTNSTLTDDLGLYSGIYNGTPLYNQSSLLNEGVSVEFDGISDSARVSDDPALRPGAGEYSIEFWMKFTNSAVGLVFGKFSSSPPHSGIAIYTNLFGGSTSGAEGRLEFRDTPTSGYWVDSIQGSLNDGVVRHYVFQRRLVDVAPDVWKLELYINGVLDNSTTLPSIIDNSNADDIFINAYQASSGIQYVQGNLDEMAFYAGSALTPGDISAHYAAGLLPGVGVYDNLVILDLKFNEVNGSTTFVDSSVKANVITTNGNAMVSNVQSHSGDTSLLLDGTGDYISIAHSDGLFSIKGNYTVECWIYRTSANPISRDVIITKYSGSGSGFYIEIGDDGKLFAGYGTGSYELTTLDMVIPVGQWVHIAFCKDGSVFRGYLDGVKMTEYTITGTIADYTGAMLIGRNQLDTSRDFQGHIQNLKWTHGVALYTDDFTPT